jgi:hypothetical protein
LSSPFGEKAFGRFAIGHVETRTESVYVKQSFDTITEYNPSSSTKIEKEEEPVLHRTLPIPSSTVR